jgi:hypothetical protein
VAAESTQTGRSTAYWFYPTPGTGLAFSLRCLFNYFPY